MAGDAAATYDFSARTALVTGGASGIGRAVADRLQDAGATVCVLDVAVDGVPGAAVRADVSDPAQVNEAVAEAERLLGRIDVLVNAAGVAGDSVRTADTSDEEWRRVLGVNLDGTFHVCRAVVPGMVARGYGRIVLVASIAGKEGNPMAPAYSASKAAVIALAKVLGKDLALTGVIVNAVAPAVIETPMLDGLSQEHLDYMVERIPLGRTGTPAEVAALICWLASDECSFSTGAVYDISGGRATY